MPRSKKDKIYTHPEDVVCKRTNKPMFEDEDYKRSSLTSSIKGIRNIISDIRAMWKDKDVPPHIGKDLFKLNQRAYDAERELEKLDK